LRDIYDPFTKSYGLDAWAIYIHVPFCEQKCAYCDFYTLTDPTGVHPLRATFHDLIIRELELVLEKFPHLRTAIVGSIGFGGGTPSLLQAEALSLIVRGICERVSLDKEAEVGLEVQPGTMDKKSYQMLTEAGFNRFSIGLQTLNPQILTSTFRRHTVEDSLLNLEWALESGCRVGADFIANMPGENLPGFLDSLDLVAKLGVHHLSTYDLTFHPGTQWEKDLRAGRLHEPSDDERADWQLEIRSRVQELGFFTYEVSNHCRNGQASRHNCAYWECAPYVGLGPGAHGFHSGHRWFNPPQAKAWARAIADGNLYHRPSDAVLPDITRIENLHMMLRKTHGVSREIFRSRFGMDPVDCYIDFWTLYRDQGLILWDDDRLWATAAGHLVLDGLTNSLATLKA
jgi:oxygen-independent coproporphyrinogen-3 oxidase